MRILPIDPALFHPDAISTQTHAFNRDIIDRFGDAPDMWQFEPKDIRAARTSGNGPFPVDPLDQHAETITIEGRRGPIELRVLHPRNTKPRGTYLHFHGGGWVIGAAEAQDVRLRAIAEGCSLSAVSVEYRLAPEHPYPAGPDDCETAAHWLLQQDEIFNNSFLAIGGESAGAHLAALTLLRLRDKLGDCPFHAANLTAGVFDLGQTPSAKNWKGEKLILSKRDMLMFTANYLQGGEDTRDPDVSPFYASLEGMPPALFSIGTCDLLLDDSVLMASRWHAANGNAQLDVVPGGCHVFQNFPNLDIAQESNARIDAFLVECLDQQS